MSKTYDAILKGDRLEWAGEPPGEVAAGPGVPVRVTFPRRNGTARINFVDSPAEAAPWTEEKRRELEEILERLAASKAFAEIDDPVAWQREIRKDRPLPGREP